MNHFDTVTIGLGSVIVVTAAALVFLLKSASTKKKQSKLAPAHGQHKISQHADSHKQTVSLPFGVCALVRLMSVCFYIVAKA